jgi:hypothetical protein
MPLISQQVKKPDAGIWIFVWRSGAKYLAPIEKLLRQSLMFQTPTPFRRSPSI